nr:hypothetical protein [uncultured Allomuricauda sp.]
MKNDRLSQIWNSQKGPENLESPEGIIMKVGQQRRRQWISIAIMVMTIAVIFWYAVSYTGFVWNDFSFGLVLMISSLTFRVLLEILSMYRKERHLITLDGTAFQVYLKRHYKIRQWINYYITPICFGIYCYGFIKLLPFFEKEFSKGFYYYLLISGFVSIAFIAWIIVRSIIREQRNLNELKA